MRYYLIIENNAYTVLRVKLEDVDKCLLQYGEKLLLQANSLMDLLLLFQQEVAGNSNLHLN